tara:strand:+ start:511 stop:1140 length:630 start_codon:yes stop_codon:yes gene_type:complete
MEKDIILFIIVICVIYLLYKVNKKEKESFNATSNDIPITESIKNLGIIAKEIQRDGNLTVPANLNVNGKFNLLPEGTIVMWGKTNIPDGWVKCDGENNTPDLRGRFVLGEGNKSGDGLTARTLNQTGGDETHTLTVHEMPSHTHTISGTYMRDGGKRGSGGGYFPHRSDRKTEINMSSLLSLTNSNTGSGHAHNNMPPFRVLIYIMKVY